MVFNAAVGNVDDHLKNFWMLAKPEGYRLAPAFDLLPDTTGRAEHTLSFRSSFSCPARSDLMAIAREWSVDDANDIVPRSPKPQGPLPLPQNNFAVRGTREPRDHCQRYQHRLKKISAQ